MNGAASPVAAAAPLRVASEAPRTSATMSGTATTAGWANGRSRRGTAWSAALATGAAGRQVTAQTMATKMGLSSSWPSVVRAATPTAVAAMARTRTVTSGGASGCEARRWTRAGMAAMRISTPRPRMKVASVAAARSARVTAMMTAAMRPGWWRWMMVWTPMA